MKQMKIILLIMLVAFVAALSYSFYTNKEAAEFIDENIELSELVESYMDTAGDIVIVRYSDDIAIVSMKGQQEVVLKRIQNSSAKKYSNEEGTLFLVENENGELIISNELEELIFIGDLILKDGDTLEDGNSELIHEDNSLVGTWTWVGTVMNSNEGINPQPISDDFSLTFNDEGRINGTTDCNSLSAEYDATDTSLSLGPIIATRMYCEGSQETEFSNLIAEVDGYMFDDNGQLLLALPYDSGTLVFEPTI